MILNKRSAHEAQLALGSGHGGELPPEPDKLPVTFLVLFILAISAVLIVVAVGSKQLLWVAADKQLEEVYASVPNPELVELRQQEDAELGDYGVVDQGKGHYRIPIKQAIEAYARSQGGNGGQ